MDVDYVVSLGAACRVTYQLRRFFSFGAAFPFDWWVTTRRGVINAIDHTYDPYSCLKPLLADEGIRSICTDARDIVFHHEFPRRWAQKGAPVSEAWRDAIPFAKSRFTYLRKRFWSLNRLGIRILFVRAGADSSATAEEFMAAVNHVIDRPENHFLFINAADAPQRVLRLNFDDVGGQRWQGDDVVWSQNLERLSIALVNPALKPFDAAHDPEVESRATTT
jgi:hypothetical protein